MESTVATQTNTLYDSDAANSNSCSCDLLSHISEREEEFEDKFCRVDSHSTRAEPSVKLGKTFDFVDDDAFVKASPVT